VPDVREIGKDGLDRLVAIRNAVVPHDTASTDGYLDWRRQAEDTIWLLAALDGVDVGAGVGVHGWHSPPGTGRMGIFVLAEARSRGAGTALLTRLGGWLLDHGCAEATSTVLEGDDASLAWAERRGFAEIGRNSILALDLAAVAAPDPQPPPGVAIVTWAERPELTAALYDVYLEAAPDIPGEEDTEIPALDEWLENDMQGASDRPEATFVAIAGDEVVGYAKLAIPAGRGDVVWHDLTGVRRAWRGRGIAGALKRAEIAWAKEQGYLSLQTFNEERNEPVRRLNERHGYVAKPGDVTVSGALASTPPLSGGS
jgi:GNAT superfamily N-acetyltransferase